MVVTTSEFRTLTEQVATNLGMGDARIVEVAHPLGGIDVAAVEKRADSVVEEMIRTLTQ